MTKHISVDPLRVSDLSRRLFLQGSLAALVSGAAVLFDLGCSPEKPMPRHIRRPHLPEPKKVADPYLFLKDAKALFPGREYAVLSNLRAFSLLGDRFVSTERGKEFLAGRDSLTILYPGSGSHLSPLEFVLQVAEASPTHIPCVKLIYTEIDEGAFSHIDSDLKKIVEATPSLSGFSVVTTDYEPGTEKSISFRYTTLSGNEVGIELLFAFRRSGGIAFYRQEYFDEADILVAHDTTYNDHGYEAPNQALQMFADGFASESGAKKPRAILIEYGHDDQYRKVLYTGVGGLIRVNSPYGCGENHPSGIHKTEFEQAAIILVNTDFLGDLAGIDPHLVKVYFDLITFKHTGNVERGVLEVPEGHPRKEDYEKFKVEVNEGVRQLLFALPNLNTENQNFLSHVLTSIIAGSFNFGILDDPQLLPYLHMIVKNRLSSGWSQPDLWQEVLKFRAGSQLPQSMRPACLGIYISELFFCYTVASKAGDSELLDKLRGIVDVDIANINEHLKDMDRDISNCQDTRVDIAYERNGLFRVKYVPFSERSAQNDGFKSIFEYEVEKIMTLLYLGSKLNCSNIAETRQFFKSEAEKHRAEVPSGSETYWDAFHRAATS